MDLRWPHPILRVDGLRIKVDTDKELNVSEIEFKRLMEQQ